MEMYNLPKFIGCLTDGYIYISHTSPRSDQYTIITVPRLPHLHTPNSLLLLRLLPPGWHRSILTQYRGEAEGMEEVVSLHVAC